MLEGMFRNSVVKMASELNKTPSLSASNVNTCYA